MNDACTVYVTAASREEALAIARQVVEERLAACANVIDGLTSIYHWQGEVEEEREVALLLKTRLSLFDALEARVRALHSYACPCIVAWPMVAGSPDYLAWIAAGTRAPGAMA
ncbi:MAG: divalent-cation tolerance protein CutA [Proteobacteria bacterium]|nr:MAG: divalent-cation tolerance protein CutA [Pseudomonadota bacterium]